MKKFNDRKRAMGVKDTISMRPDLDADMEQHLTTVGEPASNSTDSKDRGYIPTDDFSNKIGKETKPWNKNRPRMSGGIK